MVRTFKMCLCVLHDVYCDGEEPVSGGRGGGRHDPYLLHRTTGPGALAD